MILKTLAPQNTKDTPYPYFQHITVRGFSPDYSVEEKICISKALDTIQFLINLDDFRILLEEIVFLEPLPTTMEQPTTLPIDPCGISYLHPSLCKERSNRNILSTKTFLDTLEKTSKEFVFYKKEIDSERTVAIALIGGEEIIWNSLIFNPIDTLERRLVIVTLFHEMMHSLGYVHSTRIPYAAAKALGHLYKKYESTPIFMRLFGKFQKLQQEKELSIPHSIRISRLNFF